MRYTVTAPGFALAPVEVEVAGWLSGPRLLQNGERAPKGTKRGTFALRRDDGAESVARLRPSVLGLDPVPAVEIDGTRYDVVKRFAWYELIWLGLPVLLVFQGGAIGAILGIMAMSWNARVFRSDRPALVRYALTAGISILAVEIGRAHV